MTEIKPTEINVLVKKKQAAEKMQLQLNVMKLEVRLLEIEDEKIRITENIEEQNKKISEL
jgi:hypothetical protein